MRKTKEILRLAQTLATVRAQVVLQFPQVLFLQIKEYGRLLFLT